MIRSTRLFCIVALPFMLGEARAEEPPAPSTTAMAPERVESRVIAIEGKDLVLDVAASTGFVAGDVLELWRPVKLRHPVTRAVLTDRFLIGRLRLTQVRDVLSLARIEGELAREPRESDVVVGTRARNVAVATPSAVSAPRHETRERAVPREARSVAALPEATTSSSDPDSTAVSALFETLAGASVVERIRRYEAYAQAHPESRHTRALAEEALALRKLVTLHEARRAEEEGPTVRSAPPDHALAEVPLSLGVDVEGGAPAAILHVRGPDMDTYASQPMVAAGPGYFVATVPAEAMRSPFVEFFIEAVTPTGGTVAVVGTGTEPQKVRVDRVPMPKPSVIHRTRLSVLTDYADYNRLRGNDRVWQTEGTIGLRFADVGMRALRSGFGVYRGVGGSIEELDDQGLEPRAVGLTYGHLEGEVAFHPSWALIGRAVVGLGDEGVDGGAQLHLRIGSDLGTNLTLGGEFLGGVGLRGITELAFAPEGQFPILLRSEVTNQPAGSVSSDDETLPPLLPGRQEAIEPGEVGVRVIAQAGYRLAQPLVISVRGSYQGRTINHAGPGVGGAVTYSW